MAKENLMEFEGVVVDVLPNAKFKVKLQKVYKLNIFSQYKQKLILRFIKFFWKIYGNLVTYLL